MSPEFIKKLTIIVETNLSDENFGPKQLTEKLGISRSTLHRRLKKVTGKTISQFIRDIRLEKASKLLLTEESTISEIAYKVGFGSVTYFNRCFHELFGSAPSEYKKKETEKENTIYNEDRKTGFRKRRILLLASLLIIVSVLFFLNKKYSFLSSGKQPEKSIAVMPFTFSGENQDKEYMSKGIEDNISNNLSKIRDLTVIAVYELETPEKIRKKLHVTHLLDGIFHQTGNDYWLFVKLIDTKNNRLEWSDSYKLSDQYNFSTENEVAQTIARKLHANISKEEKILIAKKSTINPEANDFYQMGKAAHMEFWLDERNSDALQKAEGYYQKAIIHDQTFAAAYTGLAHVAYDRRSSSDIFNENYLDTVLELANTALSFDNTLSDAYVMRGNCFLEKNPDKVVKEYEQALLYDPNNWQAYYGLARFYLVKDNIQSVEYFLEAAKRYRGPEYGLMLSWLSFEFTIYGLFEQAEYFNKLKLDWDNDSVIYYIRKAGIEMNQEHFKKSNEYALKANEIDPGNLNVNGIIGFNYIILHEYKNALVFYEKASKLASLINYKGNNEFHRLGYVYLENRDTIQAKEYFKLQLEACDTILSRNNQDITVQYDLAATYAILGQKDKAFENLRIFTKAESIQWFLYFYMKNDPLLDNIRNEPEFEQILEDVKQKATTTRDKLKAWVDQQKNI